MKHFTVNIFFKTKSRYVVWLYHLRALQHRNAVDHPGLEAARLTEDILGVVAHDTEPLKSSLSLSVHGLLGFTSRSPD